MPTPLALNDDEYSAVMQAAQPVHPLQRGAFLQALAEGRSIPLSVPGSCTAARPTCSVALLSRRTAKRRAPPSRDI
jgi:hypothetical protein